MRRGGSALHAIIRLAPAALLLSGIMAGPALAQSRANPGQGPALAAKTTTAGTRVSTSPQPTFDEGTTQRIAAAMLSYSALEVRGGWPTIPASSKLVPGARGADVALLRQRLALTDDLAAEKSDGDVYDDALVAAVKHFQARHG